MAAPAAISAPVILKQRKAADSHPAIGHLKQIGAMLLEFDAEYGRFPDDETAREVKRATNGTLLHPDRAVSRTTTSARCWWALAAGPRHSFWCKTAQSPERPNNNFSTRKRRWRPARWAMAISWPARPKARAPAASRACRWSSPPSSRSGPTGPSIPSPSRARRWSSAQQQRHRAADPHRRGRGETVFFNEEQGEAAEDDRHGARA